MNKLIFFLFFLSTSTFADLDPNDTIRGAGSAPSGECHSCRTDDSHQIAGISLPTTRPRNGSRDWFNPACNSFIQSNGSYGPWGKLIVDYINGSQRRKSDFFDDAILGMESAPRTCPNWGRLSDDAKMKFWVWMMASIAQVESSCDPASVNTGRVPNPADRPRGLFQLNTLNTRASPRSWRGDNCDFPSGPTATANPTNNVKCAIGIMYEYVKSPRGQYSSQRKIFPTNSYWEKLRTNHSSSGGPIGKLIRQYPPCGATP